MLSQKKTDRLDHGNTTMTLSEPPTEQWERNTNTKQRYFFSWLIYSSFDIKTDPRRVQMPRAGRVMRGIAGVTCVVLGHFLFPLPVWSSCARVCTLFAYCSWSHRHNNSTRAFTEQTYPKAKKNSIQKREMNIINIQPEMIIFRCMKWAGVS